MNSWLILIIIIPSIAFGHGKKHAESNRPEHHLVVADSFEAIYKNINSDYKIKIEPVFKAKCFDCHSAQTKYPWYYQIPGINLLINSHIREARSHMDMAKGFPFSGHGTPLEDLNELEKTIGKESMPPTYYKLFHKDSSLNNEEKSKVLNWIKNSKNKLKDLK